MQKPLEVKRAVDENILINSAYHLIKNVLISVVLDFQRNSSKIYKNLCIFKNRFGTSKKDHRRNDTCSPGPGAYAVAYKKRKPMSTRASTVKSTLFSYC